MYIIILRGYNISRKNLKRLLKKPFCNFSIAGLQ